MTLAKFKKVVQGRQRAALRAALRSGAWEELDQKCKKSIPKCNKYATIGAIRKHRTAPLWKMPVGRLLVIGCRE